MQIWIPLPVESYCFTAWDWKMPSSLYWTHCGAPEQGHWLQELCERKQDVLKSSHCQQISTCGWRGRVWTPSLSVADLFVKTNWWWQLYIHKNHPIIWRQPLVCLQTSGVISIKRFVSSPLSYKTGSSKDFQLLSAVTEIKLFCKENPNYLEPGQFPR